MAKKDMPQILLPHSGLQMRYCPALAKEVGPIESVLLLQIEWWLHHSNKVVYEDGEWWLKEGMRGIALAMGMQPSTAYDLLKKLEKRTLVKLKDAPKGARIPITLNWESVRNMNSLEVKVSETRKEVSETRIHKESDSLDSKESSSSLLTRLAALEKENRELRAELNKKPKPKKEKAAKPANWGSVLAHVNQLWPGGAGASARKLEAAWETYPQLWDQVIPVLDKCFAKLGAKAYSPGAFVFSEFEVMAAIGQAPQGGEGADTKVSSWRRSHANRGES